MQRAIAILPQLNAYPHTRSSRCPYCGGVLHRRRGKVRKRVKDIYMMDEVMAARY